MTYRITPHSDELCHYGVLGMRWGVRRYQNYDGTRIGTGGTPVVNKAKTAEGTVKKLKGTMDKAFNNSVSGGQGGKAKGNARLAAIANPKIGKTLKNAKFAAAAGGPKQEIDTKALKEHMSEPSVKQGKGKDNITPTEDAAKDVSKLTESGKRLTDLGKKYDPKVKKVGEKASEEAKHMSDKELRETINRIKMEKEYRSLKESDVTSGWEKAGEILDVVGTVAQVVGTLASLYLTYKLAKGASLKHSDIPYAEAELYNYMIENNFDEDVIQHFIAMDDEYVDDFLEHYGVLGMKWGVRRYQNYDGTRIGTGSGTGGGGGGSIASKSFRGSVVTGQGGRATGNARLAAARDPGPEPEGYSAKRQYHEDKLKQTIKSSKSLKERKVIKDELARYKKESDEKAKEYLQWEKRVKKKVGNTKEYDPIKKGEKFTGEWINRHSGQVISNKEYWTAGHYDTLPFWKKII